MHMAKSTLMSRMPWAALCVLSTACMSHVLPLVPEPPAATPPSATPPGATPPVPPATVATPALVDVVTRLAGAADPLVVRGRPWQFSELEHALGRATATAVAPWAQAHRAERAGGWQIQLDLIKADASWQNGMLATNLGVRATLRGMTGQVYLAQTQTFCSASGPAQTEQEGRDLVWRCLAAYGRNLAGWLDGVKP